MLKLINEKQDELIFYANKHNYRDTFDLEIEVKNNIAKQSFMFKENNKDYTEYFSNTNKFDYYQAKFELEFYNPDDKINIFNDLIDYTRNILKHYHPILGVDNNLNTFHSKFEDNEWTEYSYPNTKYELKEAEFIFENSISIANKDNEDVIFFLKHIKRILKLSTDIPIKLRVIRDDKYDMIWVLIVIKLFN
jgi:hypothetical protein